MKVRIQVYGFLRNLVGSGDIDLELPNNSNLREVLSAIVSRFPELQEAITRDGKLRPYFVLLVNETDYEILGGYEYVVKDGDSIQLLPISHGGALEPLQRYINEINAIRIHTCLVSEDVAKKLLSYVDSIGPGCVAQIIPGARYYGASYSALIAYLTLRSITRRLNVSKKKSLEFLLYYFGDRQISNVLSMLQGGESEEYVVIYACLGDLTEPENKIHEIVSGCKSKPIEPLGPPEEALDRLVRGILKLLA